MEKTKANMIAEIKVIQFIQKETGKDNGKISIFHYERIAQSFFGEINRHDGISSKTIELVIRRMKCWQETLKDEIFHFNYATREHVTWKGGIVLKIAEKLFKNTFINKNWHEYFIFEDQDINTASIVVVYSFLNILQNQVNYLFNNPSMMGLHSELTSILDEYFEYLNKKITTE